MQRVVLLTFSSVQSGPCTELSPKQIQSTRVHQRLYAQSLYLLVHVILVTVVSSILVFAHALHMLGAMK